MYLDYKIPYWETVTLVFKEKKQSPPVMTENTCTEESSRGYLNTRSTNDSTLVSRVTTLDFN